MPIITIFGATGTQGSSVLEAVLADGKYTPRAVSRDLDSAVSTALIARGIEVVRANLVDIESIKDAIRGSDAVFGTTSSWDPEAMSAGPRGVGEIAQGKNLVDAAKEVGVKFFIWSSLRLPDTSKDSNGLYDNVWHVDSKAAIEAYLRESGVPHAVLFTAWFADNLWKLKFLKEKDMGYILPVPKFDTEDIQSATWIGRDLGAAAVALLSNYNDDTKGVLGSVYPVVSMQFTYPQLAGAIAAAIKKPVKFVPVETTGVASTDEMYLLQAKIGLYRDTPVPNPALVALDMQFGSLEEFIQREVVPRFA
ncbi:NAD(P)-binding protein [Mycena latifolia]|nr:NAD(P)-binding protein [Mycena latifolia]